MITRVLAIRPHAGAIRTACLAALAILIPLPTIMAQTGGAVWKLVEVIDHENKAGWEAANSGGRWKFDYSYGRASYSAKVWQGSGKDYFAYGAKAVWSKPPSVIEAGAKVSLTVSLSETENTHKWNTSAASSSADFAAPGTGLGTRGDILFANADGLTSISINGASSSSASGTFVGVAPVGREGGRVALRLAYFMGTHLATYYVYEWQPSTKVPENLPSAAAIDGTWKIVANGQPGEMTLQSTASGQFSGTFHWPLVNGALRGNTMTFRRQYPGGYQDYTGTVSVASDGAMSVQGTFTQDGQGSSRWSATKAASGASPTPPVSAPSPTKAPDSLPGTAAIDGPWRIRANDQPGEMTIRSSAPGQFSGTVLTNALVNGTLRGNTMTFRRQYTGGHQDYTGTVTVAADGTISVKGTFTQDGQGSYPWSATKVAQGPSPTQKPTVTPSPTAKPSPTPSPTAKPSPTPSPTAKPSPTPSPRPPQPSPLPPPPQGMLLQAERRQVKAGETVLLPVSLINGADVANMNFTVSYDPGVAVSAGPIVRGNLLGSALFEQNPTERGLMRVGYAQSGGITGTGPVAAIPFRAVGKPGDRTSVRLVVTTINNSAGSRLQIARVDGEILIVGAGGELPLDCDGDTVITAADARCALQMSVNLRPPNLVMDADADRQVTSNDARLILRKVVGK